MQARSEQETQTGNQTRLTRMDVQPNIYMLAKVPAKCPGKPTTQFKPITSNSSSKITTVYPSAPLGCNIQLSGCSPYATSCIAPKYWDLPHMPPSRTKERSVDGKSSGATNGATWWVVIGDPSTCIRSSNMYLIYSRVPGGSISFKAMTLLGLIVTHNNILLEIDNDEKILPRSQIQNVAVYIEV